MAYPQLSAMRQSLRLAPAIILAWTANASAGGLGFVQHQPYVALTAPGLKDVVGLAVSPDGANIYTASEGENAVGVYTRDLVTGVVTFLELEEDGTAGVDGLRRTTSVAVSPDGNCVYATGAGDDEVATFSRSLVTGALTFAATNAAAAAQLVVVSPDDLHVYVLGSLTGSTAAIEVFSRTPPACALSFVEQETGDGSGLGKISEGLAISPDGAHLYAGGSFNPGNGTEGALNVLSRNPVTGVLTFVEREIDGTGGVDRMGKVDGVTVSPDGGTVYVASRGGDAVIVFDRDGGTGALSFVEYQRDGGVVDGLKGAADLAVSPDNAYVYVTGRGDGSAAVFLRDTATGALRFLENNEDPDVDPPNFVLEAPLALAVSPAGDSVYVGGRGAAVFAVDACGNGNRGTDEHCDDGDLVGGDGCSATCRLELCGALPSAGCRGTLPSGAQLRIKNQTPDTKDQLQFKYNTGDATTLAEFGDPTTTASYLVCLYDGSVAPQPLRASAAPAGGLCKKGKACWKAAATSYKYGDGLYTPDGIQGLTVKEGLVNGKTRIQVKSRGINILPPALPFTLPVTVQVHNTQTGVCWDAVFSAADANDAESFKARGE